LLSHDRTRLRRTDKPATEEGLKKNPPGPTITVTVAALAIVGWKTRNGAMIATNTAMRSEEVFIASITTACGCRQFGAIREK
jgi:hypothetical protein